MENIHSFLHYILHSNIINFLIMLWILYVILKKININLHFDDAIKSVHSEIINSEEKKQIAQANYADTMEMIKSLPDEINTIKSNSDKKLNALELSIKNDTELQKANIYSFIQKNIASEKQKLYTTLTINTVNQAVEKAKENIINKLKNDPNLHNTLIENSIKELDTL